MSTQEMTLKNENNQEPPIPVKGQNALWQIIGIWLAGGAFNLFDAVCPPGFATPLDTRSRFWDHYPNKQHGRCTR